ncbi:SIS domain-containing protein [Paracoccus tegillarcae]|uniref:SIS domain-containing protein n=1 Tax=Paracoccus tegillarcae TaxID=1529068 RepID=UPI00130098E5|nr:SIS domain-containing protein [Paracoccus tegillarcae]
MLTISRGPSLAIASEAALKLKETCGIHAEAFSSAEVIHGPLALAKGDLAALVFQPDPHGRASAEYAVQRMRASGSSVYTVGQDGHSPYHLPVPSTGNDFLDPIAAICAFYVFAEQLAGTLGLDPDSPPNLNKITVTV